MVRRRTAIFTIALATALTAAACGDPEASSSTSVSAEALSTTTTSLATTSLATTSLATTSTSAPSTSSSTSATSSTEASATSASDGVCQPGPVPDSAGLDPFYATGCDLDGFWVVAAAAVDPAALVIAAELVSTLFADDEMLAATLRATDIRLGIIGREQRTTEMPEYRDLYEAFPGTDWDNRARGLGATLERPLVSAGEENLLCLDSDRYRGEDILLHEFAHVLHEWGYAAIDPTFQPRLETAYASAIEEGLWAETYASENPAEYWAEAVQSYFGRNLTAEPADGIHGPIDSRSELAAADPAIFALIDEKLAAASLPVSCYD